MSLLEIGLTVGIALGCGVIANLLTPKVRERLGKTHGRQYQLDSVSLGLLNSAARLLPKEERETYREEWFMVLCDLDTPAERIKHAADFARGAVQMRAGDAIEAGREWVSAVWAKMNPVKRIEEWLDFKRREFKAHFNDKLVGAGLVLFSAFLSRHYEVVFVHHILFWAGLMVFYASSIVRLYQSVKGFSQPKPSTDHPTKTPDREQ